MRSTGLGASFPDLHAGFVGAGVADASGEDDLQRLGHELIHQVKGVVAQEQRVAA
jgi:hypothetical protein